MKYPHMQRMRRAPLWSAVALARQVAGPTAVTLLCPARPPAQRTVCISTNTISGGCTEPCRVMVKQVRRGSPCGMRPTPNGVILSTVRCVGVPSPRWLARLLAIAALAIAPPGTSAQQSLLAWFGNGADVLRGLETILAPHIQACSAQLSSIQLRTQLGTYFVSGVSRAPNDMMVFFRLTQALSVALPISMASTFHQMFQHLDEWLSGLLPYRTSQASVRYSYGGRAAQEEQSATQPSTRFSLVQEQFLRCVLGPRLPDDAMRHTCSYLVAPSPAHVRQHVDKVIQQEANMLIGQGRHTQMHCTVLSALDFCGISNTFRTFDQLNGDVLARAPVLTHHLSAARDRWADSTTFTCSSTRSTRSVWDIAQCPSTAEELLLLLLRHSATRSDVRPRMLADEFTVLRSTRIELDPKKHTPRNGPMTVMEHTCEFLFAPVVKWLVLTADTHTHVTCRFPMLDAGVLNLTIFAIARTDRITRAAANLLCGREGSRSQWVRECLASLQVVAITPVETAMVDLMQRCTLQSYRMLSGCFGHGLTLSPEREVSPCAHDPQWFRPYFVAVLDIAMSDSMTFARLPRLHAV